MGTPSSSLRLYVLALTAAFGSSCQCMISLNSQKCCLKVLLMGLSSFDGTVMFTFHLVLLPCYLSQRLFVKDLHVGPPLSDWTDHGLVISSLDWYFCQRSSGQSALTPVWANLFQHCWLEWYKHFTEKLTSVLSESPNVSSSAKNLTQAIWTLHYRFPQLCHTGSSGTLTLYQNTQIFSLLCFFQLMNPKNMTLQFTLLSFYHCRQEGHLIPVWWCGAPSSFVSHASLLRLGLTVIPNCWEYTWNGTAPETDLWGALLGDLLHLYTSFAPRSHCSCINPCHLHLQWWFPAEHCTKCSASASADWVQGVAQL